MKEELGYSTLTEIATGYGNTGLTGIGSTSSTLSAETQAYKYNDFFITPAIDFSYKKVLDFQGGVLANVAHETGGGRQVFPFASLSLDLLRLGNNASGSGLKIFGSYSQRSAASLQDFGLVDLSNGLDLGFTLLNPFLLSTTGFGFTVIPSGQAGPGDGSTGCR
jgi:hypothetical protein